MNLFSKKKKFERKVSLKQETRDGILSYCKMSHPDEGILFLREKSKHGNVLIDGLVIPPFSETGADFAGFPHNPLPLVPSYVGIVHSHPVGYVELSLSDLNSFFGLVSMIVKSPYVDEEIFVWDSSGNKIPLDIV